MRIDKFEESKQRGLIDIMYNIIRDDNKIINGFKFDYESMSGTFQWVDVDHYYLIYATPYWEDNNKLPINIMNSDGDDFYVKIVKLEPLKSEVDIHNAIKKYYSYIKNITMDLKSRSKLKEDISKILKQTHIVINSKIDDNYIGTIKTIDILNFDTLPVEDIKKLNDIIKEKYSHFIDAENYNL